MKRALFFTGAFTLGIISSAAAQQCLHGDGELPAQHARREAALRVAYAINAAQPGVIGPRRTRRLPYRPLEQLMNVPPTPDGFRLNFQTDGATYMFSIKDTRDPCGYALFSDQDKEVYEATPRAGGVVMPVRTKTGD